MTPTSDNILTLDGRAYFPSGKHTTCGNNAITSNHRQFTHSVNVINVRIPVHHNPYRHVQQIDIVQNQYQYSQMTALCNYYIYWLVLSYSST